MKDEFQEFFGTKESPSVVQILNTTPAMNQRSAAYIFKKERPIHRVVLEYSAQGYTDVEIGKMTDLSSVAVGYIRKQPQYQQLLAEMVKEKVNEDQRVVEVIKQNVVKAVEFYQEILDDQEAKREHKFVAAEALLNRRYGKPNTPINRGSDIDLNNLSDSELAQMCGETDRTATTT